MPTSLLLLSRSLDGLYRSRWWIAAAVMAVLVLVVADGEEVQPVTWLLFGLLLTFVWIPISIRWARRLRQAMAAFREGLEGR